MRGVVFPVVASLSQLEDSHPEPEESRKRLGAFLTLTALQVNVVTSAMFLTAMAGNPVAQEAARKLGVEISWGDGHWPRSCPASSVWWRCRG